MKKYNVIDLFSGCGGLLDGFLQTGLYNPLASVEWEIAPVNTLRKRLKEKYNIKHADESVLFFDIQRTEELLNGYDDEKFGSSIGLKKIIGDKKVDFIIGGPPCQAYSVAGRIRDSEKMKNDYRNYLFEYYLKVVKSLNPKLFVFENVPGMLTAMPGGVKILDLIKEGFESIGFELIDDVKKYAVVNSSEYGVPQNRRRVILVGLNKKYFKKDRQKILEEFYTNIFSKYKEEGKTVEEVLQDMPKIYPHSEDSHPSHYLSDENVNYTWHIPRYHSLRDIKIFQMLAKDIETGQNLYTDSNVLRDIYNEVTGGSTKVHKYHVLRKNEVSTTILAHLHKDGLRFIHYDPKQARSITVREAARLQSFDDDFDFIGTMGSAYKMIGNAVPPKLAKKIALALNDLMEKIN